MRYLFSLFGVGSLFLAQTASAATYYVSSAGSDAADGSQANPWQTIAKVNASTLAAGDQVLFRRGDTFEGSLIPPSSGAAGNPIVFGAYGSGAKPIITGLTKIADATWKSIGNNLYEAPVVNGGAMLNGFFMAGALKPLARYPKATDANAGYLAFDTHSGQTSITDAALAGAPNFTGGEVVIRMVHWLDYRTSITSHSGNTLTFPQFAQSATYPLADGSGYFVQNHPAAATLNGEWYYTSATKTVGVRGASAPTGVEVSTVDRLVSMTSRNYLTFQDLAFNASNAEAIYGNSVTNIVIQSCDIRFAGAYAIYINTATDVKIEKNTILDSLSDGVYVRTSMSGGISVTDNRIERSGLVIGMSQGSRTSNEAINVTVNSNAVISRNTIIDTGFIPIRFNGNDVLVENNVIDGYCSVLDDGGGIYTWNGPKTIFANRRVLNNILTRGIGAKEGTISNLTQANGIYLDNNTNHVEVRGNTAYGMANKGFHTNSPQDIVIAQNTFFDNQVGWTFTRWPDDGSAGGNGGQDIKNIDVHDNIFVQPDKTQTAVNYGDRALNFPSPTTIDTRLSAVGNVDGNYYYDPHPIPFSYFYRLDKSSPFVIPPEKSFDQWKLISSLEASSKLLTPFPDYKINSLVGANLYPEGTYESGIGTIGAFPAGAYTLSADNTGKITGMGSLRIDLTPPANEKDYVLFYHSIGPVTQGKRYVLRFSTVGTSEQGLLRASIRKTTNPYTTVTPQIYSAFGTKRVDHEFVLAPDSTHPDGSWKIDILQSSGTVYIDNLEITEADVTDLDPREKIRFEVNAETNPKVISLDKTYVDARDVAYCGDITLQPFTSLVLFESSTPCTPSMGSGSSTSSSGSGASGGNGSGGNGAGGNDNGGAGGIGGAAEGGAGGAGAGTPGGDAGCACSTAGSSKSGFGAAWALALWALTFGRKRRSSKQ